MPVIIFWAVAAMILIAAVRIVLRAVLPARVWTGVESFAGGAMRLLGRALVIGVAVLIVAAIYWGANG